MENISDRIHKIRIYFCDDNNTLFSEKLGLSKQQSSNYVNGNRNPGKKKIDEILAAFPQVNPAWLVLGEGPMLKTETPPAPSTPPSQQMNINGNNNSNNSMIAHDHAPQPFPHDQSAFLFQQIISSKDDQIASLQQRIDEQSKLIDLFSSNLTRSIEELTKTIKSK